jgi:hypothetical protein
LGGVFIGQFEFEFAFLRAQHDRLAVHPPDHVEGRTRCAAQGHLQEIVLNPRFEGLAQFGLDFEEPIGRAEPADPLIGPFVIVVLHPGLDPLPGILERVKRRPGQKLLPDGGPEPLDLAQRHRVVRTALDVRHPILAQFGLEARGAAPGRILASVVGEHFLGRLKLAAGDAIHFDDRLGGGTAKQIGPRDETRIIIQEPDQIRILAAQPEREDIRLPHLVGRGPLEEAGAGEVARAARAGGLQQARPVQLLTDRLRAGFHQEEPAHPLRDALDPKGRMLALEPHDRLRDGRRKLGPPRRRVPARLLQTGFPLLAIAAHPPGERLLRHAQFLRH